MRSSKAFLLCCLLILGALLALSFGEQKQEGAGSAPELKSLVRMDLLFSPADRTIQTRRNIFAAHLSGGSRSSAQGVFGTGEDIGRGDNALQQGQAGFSVNLRYVGYVKSGPKITALIVFEGEVLAVERGEMIAFGVQVIAISKEEIEVMGPDQESRKFPLEGDRT